MRRFLFATQCAWSGEWDWIVIKGYNLTEATTKAYNAVDWEGGCPPAFERELV